jgi:hypothetical protein
VQTAVCTAGSKSALQFGQRRTSSGACGSGYERKRSLEVGTIPAPLVERLGVVNFVPVRFRVHVDSQISASADSGRPKELFLTQSGVRRFGRHLQMDCILGLWPQCSPCNRSYVTHVSELDPITDLSRSYRDACYQFWATRMRGPTNPVHLLGLGTHPHAHASCSF